MTHHITFMPPGEYNPNNAGIFEAIKVPEKPKGPEKKGPNLERLAELKAAADARKVELQQREASLKTAEVPQINAVRDIAEELAGENVRIFTKAETQALHDAARGIERSPDGAILKVESPLSVNDDTEKIFFPNVNAPKQQPKKRTWNPLTWV